MILVRFLRRYALHSNADPRLSALTEVKTMHDNVHVRPHRHAPVLPFKRRKLMLGGLFSAALMSPEISFASASSFDLDAFSPAQGEMVDTTRFNAGNAMSPGTYRVDIIVNGQPVGRRDLDFKLPNEAASAQPCLTREMLEQLGIAMDKVETTGSQALHGQYCGDLGQWVPLASSSFDVSTLEWSASVPQAYLQRSRRGYIDPAYWDEGITAGLLNYNFSTSAVTEGKGQDRAYLGLNAGLNLGAWRLRHQGAQAWDNPNGLQTYQNTATYVQRSIAPLESQLTVGDTFSNGQILEGVRVRGVTLATDTRMLPQSQQGYAPQVRGIAESNATVTISQNGYTIYETTVAPGPFVIDDLNATGQGGDLTVSVTEVDGRRNTFVVPYSVAPQLLREGATHYSVTAGRVQQRGVADNKEPILQGTLQHGLSDYLTAYGGSTLAEEYTQGKLGVAIGTALGAFSLDGSLSSAGVQDQGQLSGRSFGLGYNKTLHATGTHLAMGAYRFSTEGYLSLPDALNVRDLARRGQDTLAYARQKSRLDLTINQKLGDGTLSLYASSVDYWRQQQGRQTSFTASYGSTWNTIGWNLSAQRSRVQDTQQLTGREQSDEVFFGRNGQLGKVDNRFMLTLSMPLGKESNAPSVYASLSRDTGDNRGSQQQVGINGLVGDNAEGNYGISASRAISGDSRSTQANAYAGYRTDVTSLRAGYGQTRDSSQVSFGADGGVVVHGGGVTFAQSLGEASALVHVPGAEGATLGTGSATRINRGGYAVVASLTAFQSNPISVDPEGMSMDVELRESTRNVVPTLGALSLVTFETNSGRAVVLKARRENGKPLPFAAQVFDEQGREVGVIGQASKAFVRGVADTGSLTVKWSEAIDGQCRISYQLAPQEKATRQAGTEMLQGLCVDSSAGLGVSKL